MEAMLTAGEPALALETAGRYFSGQVTDPTEAVWVAIWACRAAGVLGRWGEAVSWAERGQSLEGWNDPEAAGWLQFRLGTAVMYVGDICRSERELTAFVQIAPQIPSLKKHRADGLFNLACLARLKPASQDDLRLFQEAQRDYHAHGRFNRALACQPQIAWSHLSRGNLEAARAALAQADAELADHGDPETGVDLQTTWAWYHHLRGDCEQSVSLCRAVLKEPAATGGKQADVLWILALNAMQEGDHGHAAVLAEEAYGHAVADWWPPQLLRIENLRKSLRATLAGR
jgi:tetratricopeptide (TPR) repeat protein